MDVIASVAILTQDCMIHFSFSELLSAIHTPSESLWILHKIDTKQVKHLSVDDIVSIDNLGDSILSFSINDDSVKICWRYLVQA